jgi:hypothetical protein
MFFVIGLFLVGGAWATWNFILNQEPTYSVTSHGPDILIHTYFTSQEISTQNSSVEFMDSSVLSNNNSPTNLTLLTNITKTDSNLTDGCSDFENDCQVTFFYEGELVDSNDVLDIPHGLSDLNVSIVCERYSCSHDIDVLVELVT